MGHKCSSPILPRKQSDPNTERECWYLKKYAAVRRLSALALAFVMALSLAVPALAGPSYQVRIHPDAQTSTPTSATDGRVTRFEAYQIFQGGIDSEKYEPGDIPNDPPMDGELSEIKWGESIKEDYAALLLALAEIETQAGAVGVTLELLFNSERNGARYLTAPALSGYAKEYNNPENWESDDGRETATYEDVGGKLTSQGEARLRELLRNAMSNPDLTLGSLFQAALEYEKYSFSDSAITPPPENDFSGSAQTIAFVLTDFTDPETGNTALAQAFARAVAAKEDDGAYTYLNNRYEISRWADDANDPPGYWTIGTDNVDDKTLQAGYYLIIDTYTTDAAVGGYREDDSGTAQSEFIMAVFGTQDIFVKTKVPTVKKEIVNYDNGNAYGDDFEIGENITFRITGALPENFANYDVYRYKFTDTLPEGLTYVSDSMAVYAVAPNGNRYRLMEGEHLSLTAFPRPENTEAEATVEFPDLKQITAGTPENASGTGSSQPFTITSDWKIVVEYQARLNKKAGFENVTSAYLTYSSSTVNNQNTANTTKAVNYIYNFGVSIEKYYEDFVDNPIGGDPEKALAGAGFSLIKDNQYALFDGDGLLSGWISQEDLGGDNIVWADITDPDGKLTVPDYAGKYIYFLTDSEGSLVDVGSFKGLKADTDYSLREVIVPEGYDEPDEDTDIRFEASYYTGAEETDQAASPGKLRTLYYRVGSEYSEIEPEGELLANLKLVNYPTDALLDTGGMGTTLFYIGGGALLAGAALIWIVSRVKKKRNEKHVRYVNTRK